MGSLYTMMALGLTMTYAVTRIANFAHAEMLTVGAYVAVVVANAFGVGPIEALAVAFVVTAVLTMVFLGYRLNVKNKLCTYSESSDVARAVK